MTGTQRAVVVGAALAISLAHTPGARAQDPGAVREARVSAQSIGAATQTIGARTGAQVAEQPVENGPKPPKSVFSEDGPVDTSWDAQRKGLWRALFRLPTAAALSALLAFRPRRRGTPRRQAPVIQTQIVLALVGAMVMLVVGSSIARAFGIVGAAGLIRYRAKIDDPKDAGVMLSTLAIGLAAGVGMYLFAAFATVFVVAVLVVIESIDPDPYLPYELTLAAADVASLKDGIEGVFSHRKIPFELLSTAADELSYEIKLPVEMHTDTLSRVLTRLRRVKPIEVKWEHGKDAKAL